MKENKSDKIAVLVSGTGTILASMIKKKVPIELVMADRECQGLEIAKNNSIKTVAIERKKYGWDPKSPKIFRREEFSRDMALELVKNKISITALAGFMTILGKPFFEEYKGLILNTHPALLPSFPGAHACNDAIEYGVKVSGCTIHEVTEMVDKGKIIAQETVKVEELDNAESLQEKIKRKERKIYPKILLSLIKK